MQADNHQGLVTLSRRQELRVSGGSVRGLLLSASFEPEAALAAATLHVPRLAPPYSVHSMVLSNLTVQIDELDAHTAEATKRQDMPTLMEAYTLLETLCQQYVRDAVGSLRERDEVPAFRIIAPRFGMPASSDIREHS